MPSKAEITTYYNPRGTKPPFISLGIDGKNQMVFWARKRLIRFPLGGMSKSKLLDLAGEPFWHAAFSRGIKIAWGNASDYVLDLAMNTKYEPQTVEQYTEGIPK